MDEMESLTETQMTDVLSWFHEGNGCSEEAYPVRSGSDRSSIGGGWHDEFRSIDFRGPEGTTLTVFDSRNYGTGDDYTIIIKRDDDPVCVLSFQRVPPNKWVTFRGYYLWWDKLNTIDGKVSSFRWGEWW